MLLPRNGVEDIGEAGKGAARRAQGDKFGNRLVLAPSDDGHDNHENCQNAQENENVLFHEIPPILYSIINNDRCQVLKLFQLHSKRSADILYI